MCCSFQWYLPITQSSPSGYPGMPTTFLHSMVHAVCKDTRWRENQFQHVKLHHFSYITLSKLQHILTPNTYILQHTRFHVHGCKYLRSTAKNLPYCMARKGLNGFCQVSCPSFGKCWSPRWFYRQHIGWKWYSILQVIPAIWERSAPCMVLIQVGGGKFW